MSRESAEIFQNVLSNETSVDREMKISQNMGDFNEIVNLLR